MRLNKQDWSFIRQEINSGKSIHQVAKDWKVSSVAIYKYRQRNWRSSFLRRTWLKIRNLWVDEEYRR